MGPFDPAGLWGIGPLFEQSDLSRRGLSRGVESVCSFEDAVVHPRNGPRTSALAAGLFPLTLLGIASWRAVLAVRGRLGDGAEDHFGVSDPGNGGD